MLETMGWISVIPVILAVVLAFVTRNTILSLAVACITGCFLAGKGIFGFTDLIKTALGNEDFIWVVTINMMVAIMAAYFEKSGAVDGFTRAVDKRNFKRKSIQLICSPVSDTTILSSMGAGSDHIDHVKTQLPYALTVAAICAVAYLIVGFIAA